MQKLVTNGDLCMCSNGNTPCPIVVVDISRKMKSGGKSIVVATDTSVSNLSTFGMCNNLSNPAVAAATAAAQGVLTPAPCIPAIVGTWDNTVNQTRISSVPAVGEKSTVKCTYGGNVNISNVSNQSVKSE